MRRAENQRSSIRRSCHKPMVRAALPGTEVPNRPVAIEECSYGAGRSSDTFGYPSEPKRLPEDAPLYAWRPRSKTHTDGGSPKEKAPAMSRGQVSLSR